MERLEDIIDQQPELNNPNELGQILYLLFWVPFE